MKLEKEQRRAKKRGGKGLGLKSDISAYLIILPSLFCLFMFVWRPIVSGFRMSLYDTQGYSLTEFVGLDNYKAIVSDSLFTTAVANTFKYVGWSTLIGFIPPILIAIMICELRYAKSFVKFALYFPAICPVIVTSLLWGLLYEPGPGGLLNTILMKMGMEPNQWLNDANMTIIYIIISKTWQGFGGAAIIYLATLEGLPKELYESAMIDGAGIFQRIRYITLPQMWGVILLMLINNISGVFQIMTEPLTMTGGGPNNASLSLSLLSYRYGFVYMEVDKALTVGVLTFFILFVLTLFYFKLDKKVNIDV